MKIKELWCKRFGHLTIVRTNRKKLVEFKCVLCGYWLRSFSGFKPKLRFKEIAMLKF